MAIQEIKWKRVGIPTYLRLPRDAKNIDRIKKHVRGVSKVDFVSAKGREWSIDEHKETMIGYNYSPEGDFSSFKLCRPMTRKEYKWSWHGKHKALDYFPYDAFDVECDELFLVGGEKDVITMLALGYNAWCLNSESARISDEVSRLAESTGAKLYVMYDIDGAGIKNSIRISREDRYYRVELPETLVGQTYGTDITDFIQFKVSGGEDARDILKRRIQQAYREEPTEKRVTINSKMAGLNEHSEAIRKIKSGKIEFPPPIVTLDGNPEKGLIFPYTITTIQGQSGVHKSRLAEIMASLFLSDGDFPYKKMFLGMEKQDKPYHVVYVDTERNIKHQLPRTIQTIQERAGIPREHDPENFSYITLLHEKRNERFDVLKQFLNEVNKDRKGFLVVILDVVTDCVSNFNDINESMMMIDLLNQMINDEECSFICVIHENPGKEQKARGHLGTEIYNKASTAIKVSMENGNIMADFPKTRLADFRLFSEGMPMDFDKAVGSLMRVEDLGSVTWSEIDGYLDKVRTGNVEVTEEVKDTPVIKEIRPNEDFDTQAVEPQLSIMDGPAIQFEEGTGSVDVNRVLTKPKEREKEAPFGPEVSDVPF